MDTRSHTLLPGLNVLCAAADNDEEDEWRKKPREDEPQPDEHTDGAEHEQQEQEEAEQGEDSGARAVKEEIQSQSAEPLAWKYEDDSAVVTVRTHAPGEDEDDSEPAVATSEQYEAGNGFAERQARKGGAWQSNQKKAVVKPKKKDRKGPRKMMKSKKEKALGIKKKPRFRGR